MKIEKSELIKQIACALQDEFVAEITQEADAIGLRFVSGQKFILRVEEEK